MKDLKPNTSPGRARNREPNSGALGKDECPANPLTNSWAIETEGLRRRGSYTSVANLFLTRGLLFDASIPVCLRAVENLDSPQHDNDGQYQRGRRQRTFYGSDSHTTLRFPAPLAV